MDPAVLAVLVPSTATAPLDRPAPPVPTPAVAWTDAQGVRVGAYLTPAGALRHVVIADVGAGGVATGFPVGARGSALSPSFETVRDLDRALRQLVNDGSTDDGHLDFLLRCRAWLQRLRDRWHDCDRDSCGRWRA